MVVFDWWHIGSFLAERGSTLFKPSRAIWYISYIAKGDYLTSYHPQSQGGMSILKLIENSLQIKLMELRAEAKKARLCLYTFIFLQLSSYRCSLTVINLCS